jgi:hypothetical protein
MAARQALRVKGGLAGPNVVKKVLLKKARIETPGIRTSRRRMERLARRER